MVRSGKNVAVCHDCGDKFADKDPKHYVRNGLGERTFDAARCSRCNRSSLGYGKGMEAARYRRIKAEMAAIERCLGTDQPGSQAIDQVVVLVVPSIDEKRKATALKRLESLSAQLDSVKLKLEKISRRPANLFSTIDKKTRKGRKVRSTLILTPKERTPAPTFVLPDLFASASEGAPQFAVEPERFDHLATALADFGELDGVLGLGVDLGLGPDPDPALGPDVGASFCGVLEEAPECFEDFNFDDRDDYAYGCRSLSDDEGNASLRAAVSGVDMESVVGFL
jgi:hypothetical protein